MLAVAPLTTEGTWLLADALGRCDSARERLDRALADLRALAADCGWRARAIDRLLERCAEQQGELVGVLDQLASLEAGLRAG
ncbi:MAG: hypothetical protein JST25_14220 [Actinobacteria bacterium]|nr:hypothetical protein [Actinomycetota bacterium]